MALGLDLIMSIECNVQSLPEVIQWQLSWSTLTVVVDCPAPAPLHSVAIKLMLWSVDTTVPQCLLVDTLHFAHAPGVARVFCSHVCGLV